MPEWLDKAAMWLVIIGALNWGLHAFGWNVVDLIFGSIPWLATLIYILVGLSGLWVLIGMLNK